MICKKTPKKSKKLLRSKKSKKLLKSTFKGEKEKSFLKGKKVIVWFKKSEKKKKRKKTVDIKHYLGKLIKKVFNNEDFTQKNTHLVSSTTHNKKSSSKSINICYFEDCRQEAISIN